jgi:NAD(P)H-hydrate epimerase
VGRLSGLPDAAAQRETDRWAIEDRGIPALDLMERAGAGLAAVVAAVAPAGRAVIVCGKGNNGGDGLVAARLLREAGRQADVLLTAGADELSADAQAELDRLWGPPPESFGAAHLGDAAVIVDALLGTGFAGAPRAPLDDVIEAINAAGAPIVAADVPSGVNASTGEVEGAAVRAAATATFHAAKPGLWIHPGKGCAGTVHVVDIGIPAGAPGEPEIGLISDGMLDGLPGRAAASTKFSSGAVVVVGGSPGITGAPVMAAAAAMRAGAGYVTIATGDSGQADFARRPLEVMLRSVPDDDGFLGPASVDAVLEATARAGAVVLGPGLGRAEPVRAFVAEVARRIEAPLVIDADGLNALGGDVPAREAPTVLTPHEGELGRLLGVESGAIAAHRLQHARAAAEHAVVVLKGDDTLVAFPGGRVAVSPGGAPGLATAGTGDVLAGVVGALLARGADPEQAVCGAVLAHVRAGRLAAEPHGPDGVIATDVIAHLPAALSAQYPPSQWPA